MPAPTGQASPDPDPIRIPHRRPLGGLLNLVLAGLLAAVLIAIAVTVLTRDATVTVPELIGLSVAEAAVKASENQLTLTDPEGAPIEVSRPGDAVDGETSEGDTGSDSRRVAAQEPPAGTEVDAGSTVRVSLSPGIVQATVPDLGGLSAEQAQRTLESAGLHAGALMADPNAQAAPGNVTRQEPAAGTVVPVGTTIDLWVASATSTHVPDLSGLTQTEAEAAAQGAGLSLRVLLEVTDEVMPGQVLRQSPQPGALVAPGTTVVVVVNGAPGSTAATTSPDAQGTSTTAGSDTAGAGGGGGTQAGPVPEPYAALAAAFPFPVLYPSRVPSTFVLDPTAGNPRQLSDQTGNLAFEVRYADTTRPGALLSLIEGGLFELGTDEATTVDIRGFPGALGTRGSTVVVSWQEGPTPYLITADGLEASEVVAFASSLVPVSGR